MTKRLLKCSLSFVEIQKNCILFDLQKYLAPCPFKAELTSVLKTTFISTITNLRYRVTWLAGWVNSNKMRTAQKFKKDLKKCFSQTKIFFSQYLCNVLTIFYGIIKILIQYIQGYPKRMRPLVTLYIKATKLVAQYTDIRTKKN